MSPSKRTWRRLLGLAINLLVTVVLAELLVRLAIGERDYALEMWRYAELLKRISNDPSQVFGHKPSQHAHLMGVDVRINSLGLRGPETTYTKPPGVHRVLMLGDSLTFGWGVPEPDVTSSVLQQRLNEASPATRWEVINTGVGNYNTRLELRYLEREGLRFSPDVVVLNYFINDAEPDPRPSGNVLSHNLASYVFLANRLDLLRRMFVVRERWDAYYRGLYLPEALGWRGAQDALRKFATLCRERALHCLVTYQPELHVLEPYPFDDSAKQVQERVTEAGLPWLDLRPVLQGQAPETLWVSRQDTHPNAKADALYAQAIAKEITTRWPP